MRKFRLDINTLRVESFVAGQHLNPAAVTIRAHSGDEEYQDGISPNAGSLNCFSPNRTQPLGCNTRDNYCSMCPDTCKYNTVACN